MSPDPWPPLSRRRFLQGSAVVSISSLLPGCDGDGEERSRHPRTELPTTPACDDGDEPTPQQSEGPFYTPDTPRRRNLMVDGLGGEPLQLTGRVVDTRCRPIAGALLDFWQADDEGAYDNRGYRFRGHQFTDRRGRYRLATVVPGRYTGRTPHIHVKAQRRGGAVLTTQLYFPGEPQNADDALFDPALLMRVREGGGGRVASFRFVLA